MSNREPHSDHIPSFNTTDDFVVPVASNEDWAAIEEVFRLTHYTSAVLATDRVKREVLGGKTPQGPIGPFAVKAFAMHLVQPIDGGIGVETIISSGRDVAEADFLRSLMLPLTRLLPRGEFPFQIVTISRTLAQMGLKVAAGVYIGASTVDKSKEFVAMSIPRIYFDQLRPQGETDREDFASKLAAMAFLFLSSEYLKSLESDNTGTQQ